MNKDESKRPTICEECGLPMQICAALSSYRWAVKYYAAGNKKDAEIFASDAQTYHDKYLYEIEKQNEAFE